MSASYRIMYRLGITPWEHADPPGPLTALIEGPDALPPGDMLDIGCGTGHDAIYAARHDWNVTGVDTVPRALERARRNARAAGAAVRFLQADISQASHGELGVGTPSCSTAAACTASRPPSSGGPPPPSPRRPSPARSC
jgi:SAM-dependent methyltransferase